MVVRVLVTGFLDWRNLGDKPNIWQLSQNPSSQVLVGCASSSSPPIHRNGPMASYLRRTRPDIDWTFQTMPTLWGASNTIDYSFYDVVVHLGLGVYDCFDKIILEDGANNLRNCRPDAAGLVPQSSMIIADGPATLRNAAMSRIVQSLHGASYSGFTVTALGARDEGSYICNETYFRALTALEELREAGVNSRLAGVFFIHIPYPAPGPTADGVQGPIDEGINHLGVSLGALAVDLVDKALGV